jgi:hypothetical protein
MIELFNTMHAADILLACILFVLEKEMKKITINWGTEGNEEYIPLIMKKMFIKNGWMHTIS